MKNDYSIHSYVFGLLISFHLLNIERRNGNPIPSSFIKIQG